MICCIHKDAVSSYSERIINAMQHENIVGYDLIVKGGYFYEEMVFV